MGNEVGKMPEAESFEDQDGVIDGEILAEFDDHTLLNLPHVPDEAEASNDEPPDAGRRWFVLRLLAGGVAALALGGSAALIYDQQRRRQPQVVILPNGSQIDSGDLAALVEQIGQLNAQLEALTAERDQLLGELAQANNDLTDALALIEDQRALNDLWQQLDNVGLDVLIAGALAIVGPLVTGMVNIATLLRSGLTTAQNAVSDFIAALPGPQVSIPWLKQQIATLAASLEWLGEQVQEAVEPVEPLAQLVANFVLWVLERLPFGIGAKAEAGLQAMRDVIASLPPLVAGITDSVLDPLAEWFGEDKELNLSGILLDPIQEKVFAPAHDLLDRIMAFHTAYREQLATPAETALAERAAIRERIAALQARIAGRQVA